MGFAKCKPEETCTSRIEKIEKECKATIAAWQECQYLEDVHLFESIFHHAATLLDVERKKFNCHCKVKHLEYYIGPRVIRLYDEFTHFFSEHFDIAAVKGQIKHFIRDIDEDS